MTLEIEPSEKQRIFPIVSIAQTASPFVAFVPGEHTVVVPQAGGWTRVALDDVERAPRVLAPTEAGPVGFSAAGELLWIDERGLHATDVESGDERTILRERNDSADFEHWSSLGQNILLAPSSDRLALSRGNRESAFDLVLLDDCGVLPATFDFPLVWDAGFGPTDPWVWLKDSRRLVQQTRSSAELSADGDVRLELVQVVDGRVETRTLYETTAAEQSLVLDVAEQP
jgi:hypothetical protein